MLDLNRSEILISCCPIHPSKSFTIFWKNIKVFDCSKFNFTYI